MKTIKVLIVDDHPVVREGVRAMLQTDEGIEVVGEASDGLEAVELTTELGPDVVLMDLRMPNLDGIEATRRIKGKYTGTSVIMLTIYGDEAFVIDAVRAGAGGYLMKDASRDLLCHTIRAVNSGGILIKTSLLREAIATLTNSSSSHQKELIENTNGLVEALTSREEEVLKLLVGGLTNKEIANKIGIAEETAKRRVQNIIAKMDASDRTDAAVKAVRRGLV